MEGGQLYGFCPAKATWDQDVILLFQALTVTLETGLGWQTGGVSEQPAWWVEMAADFLSKANDLRFYSRAKAILGDGKSQPKANMPNKYSKR